MQAIPLILIISFVGFLVIQATGDPLAAFTVEADLTADDIQRLKAKYGLSDNKFAYIREDLIDIPVMEQVRFPIAVQNAHPRVKAIAAFITEASGGQGAFREAVEWVIDQQGRTKEIYQILREQILTG